MIGSFFRRLEADRVRYLLISGQATILYGAATFSEDVDLWLDPEQENLDHFLNVLRSEQARYYKLTPPLELSSLLRGHGFHFVVPDSDSNLDVFLDVMGRPPRVGTFEAARVGARRFDTDSGGILTIGIKELVELKKTQRPADYPIIGRLAVAHLEQPATPHTEAELRWALNNVFGLAELQALVAVRPAEFGALSQLLDEPLAAAVSALAGGAELSPSAEDTLDSWLEARSAALRSADRRYWRGIIDELREFRRSGRLMTESAPV